MTLTTEQKLQLERELVVRIKNIIVGKAVEEHTKHNNCMDKTAPVALANYGYSASLLDDILSEVQTVINNYGTHDMD